jgi:hypothetical protein
VSARSCPMTSRNCCGTINADAKMFVLMTLLIAGGSMAFAVHQWWHGHHMLPIISIAVAWLVAGAAIEAAKYSPKAEAPILQQQ